MSRLAALVLLLVSPALAADPPSLSASSGVAISPDGRRIYAAAGSDGMPVWEDGQYSGTWATPAPRSERGFDAPRAVAAGKDLVVAVGMAGVYRWDGSGRSLGVSPVGDRGAVYGEAVAISPDGQRYAIGRCGASEPVAVYTRTGQLSFTVGDPRGDTRRDYDSACSHAVVFLADGRLVADAGDGILVLADRDGRVLATHKVQSVATTTLVALPDGKVVVGGYAGGINVIDPTSGRATRSFGFFDNELRHLALSPDGQTLVTVVGDIRIWSLASGERVGNVKQSGPVAFSPDGQLWALEPQPHRLTW